MKRLIPLVAVCVFAATACSPEPKAAPTDAAHRMAGGDSMMADSQMSGPMAMLSPATGDTAATRDYKMATMTMMSGMPDYSGNADVDFMKQMRVHHQAAIAMARTELVNGQNAQAKALAQAVVTAQASEIATIDAWLAANGG